MVLPLWNTGKRSLTWCRRRGRWCPCQWENYSATSKTNSHGTTPSKYREVWPGAGGEGGDAPVGERTIVTQVNKLSWDYPFEIQGKEVWLGAGGVGGDAPVSEITTVPQVKQTLMGLPLRNTGKRSLTWCRQRGRWYPCWRENCSDRSKTNYHGTIPSKYRERQFDLVQAEREVMPLSVRELQRHK